MLCVEFGDASSPMSIAIASGVHGDERAAPWALMAMAEEDGFDQRFAYRIWPCINPSGYRAATRENAEGADVNRSFSRGGQTPEARAILTANRDRKFALSLDLHEDETASGFYLYEYGACDAGEEVVKTIRGAGWPIQDFTGFDLGVPFEPVHAGDGMLRMPPDFEAARLGGLSYSLSIVKHAARRALTFETPTSFPWESRIAMHALAVRAAIAKVSAESLTKP